VDHESGAPVGVVAFSFALRGEEAEPGPSNVALARAVQTATAGIRRPIVVVAQWEVARQLHRDGVPVDLVVERQAGVYLDSDMVWQAARDTFATRGVTEVVAVAQPFLHLRWVRRIIRRHGYRVLPVPIAPIPFDPDPANRQWWTKSRSLLVLYALRKLLGVSG
jgi:hypothetical protein